MKHFDKDVPKIIFCDNQLLVALKPAGWLTQTEGGQGESLEAFCKQWLKEQYQKPGNVFLHAIHRLDRLVSGLVLFARTSKALSRLNEAMRVKAIRRMYLAEVEGRLLVEEGHLEHRLDHGELSPQGQIARLSYRKCGNDENGPQETTWVRIELETGRYHQIRAQFAAIGHPIVGDVRYGSCRKSDQRIHLFCEVLEFLHPVTRELMRYEEFYIS